MPTVLVPLLGLALRREDEFPKLWNIIPGVMGFPILCHALGMGWGEVGGCETTIPNSCHARKQDVECIVRDGMSHVAVHVSCGLQQVQHVHIRGPGGGGESTLSLAMFFVSTYASYSMDTDLMNWAASSRVAKTRDRTWMDSMWSNMFCRRMRVRGGVSTLLCRRYGEACWNEAECGVGVYMWDGGGGGNSSLLCTCWTVNKSCSPTLSACKNRDWLYI